jgi:phage FluMu gp28-like protein
MSLHTILRPYQRKWVKDQSRAKLWVAARQIGKSFAVAAEAVGLAGQSKCDILLGSTSLRQSREMQQKVQGVVTILESRAGRRLMDRQTAEEVRIAETGSRIISLPANPATVRGFSGHVFLDEFAWQRDSQKIWEALYPSTTLGFCVRITSTPQGQSNMFHALFKKRAMSIHITTIYDAVAQGLPVDPVVLRENILDPDSWAQEYECQFLDEATAFLTYEMISDVEVDPEDTLWPPSLFQVRPSSSSNPIYYIGVDIGRKRDLTVIWILELVGDVLWTREVIILERAAFSVQRDALFARLPYATRACIDSTGLGMQLAEECQERFGRHRVEDVSFTAAVKEDMAVSLRLRIEERRIRIPSDRAVREDLHSVKKIATSAGHFRYDAERNDAGHADRFWALALACHAASVPESKIEYQSTGQRREGLGAWGIRRKGPVATNW